MNGAYVRHRMPTMSRPVAVLALALAATGCATTGNTPAQDLAWDRWKRCETPAFVLLRIEPSGKVWVQPTTSSQHATREWQQCMADALTAQRTEGKLAATAQPPLHVADIRELVRFAYLTDKPPATGTFLRTTTFSNMPPKAQEFSSGTSVALLYGINQVGRVFEIETRWVNPLGQVAKTLRRTLDQTGTSGLYTWQTQVFPGTELNEPGAWAVEMLIDSSPVDKYAFTVRPASASK